MNHIEMIHKMELNNILWDELNVSIRETINTRYADTKINDKVKKDIQKGHSYLHRTLNIAGLIKE